MALVSASGMIADVMNGTWTKGETFAGQFSTKVGNVTSAIPASANQVAATAVSLPTIDEPSAANMPAGTDTVDIINMFGSEYAELVAMLDGKFSSFRSSYFPNENGAYSTAESWLQNVLSNPEAGITVPSEVVAFLIDDPLAVSRDIVELSPAVQAMIWGDDQARILSDKVRAQDAVVAQFATRRFPLPPDVAANAVLQIEQKAQDELAESSRKAAMAAIEIAKFNAGTRVDVDKFNVDKTVGVDQQNSAMKLDASKFSVTAISDVRKFNLEAKQALQKFSAEKLVAARQAAMDAAIKYMSALASGPDIASRVVGIGVDAQSKLVSAMAAYYNARTQAKETIAKVAQFNTSSALEAAIKNQSADLGLLDTKIKALLSEAQAIAQMATALFNNINASAGVSSAAHNSVSYQASTDEMSGTPGWPGWA